MSAKGRKKRKHEETRRDETRALSLLPEDSCLKRTQFRMQVVQKRWLQPFTMAVSTKGTSFRQMGQDQSLLPSPAPDSLSRQAVSSSLPASSPSPPSSSVRKESSSALRSSALASILIYIFPFHAFYKHNQQQQGCNSRSDTGSATRQTLPPAGRRDRAPPSRREVSAVPVSSPRPPPSRAATSH